jgi:hypothetical protein
LASLPVSKVISVFSISTETRANASEVMYSFQAASGWLLLSLSRLRKFAESYQREQFRFLLGRKIGSPGGTG